VVGTRPEVTKGWLFARWLASHPDVDFYLICTGQQKELLWSSVYDLGLTVNAITDLLAPAGRSPWQQRFSELFKSIVAAGPPDLVCALGDTDSVRATAELCHQLSLPFVHLEAGIRHRGVYQTPEPEEINRREISRLATFHLCPSLEARANLADEGVNASSMRIVGDLSACAITCAFEGLVARIAHGEPSPIDRTWGPYALCTFHRSTSLWAQEHLLKAFMDVAYLFSDLMLVLVGRPDSRWEEFYRQVDTIPNVYLTQAMTPSVFLGHLLHCEFVITDSAGVQQESAILAKDVIACRREIELYGGSPRVHVVPPPFTGLASAVSALWPASRAAFRGEVEPHLSEVRAEGRRVASQMAEGVIWLAQCLHDCS